MIKNLTEFLDYGFFAEVALLIFALVFIAIVIRTLLVRKEVSKQCASIVLNDNSSKSKTDT